MYVISCFSIRVLEFIFASHSLLICVELLMILRVQSFRNCAQSVFIGGFCILAGILFWTPLVKHTLGYIKKFFIMTNIQFIHQKISLRFHLRHFVSHISEKNQLRAQLAKYKGRNKIKNLVSLFSVRYYNKRFDYPNL